MLLLDAAGLWLFLVSITVLTMSPGVDTILVVRNSSRGGAPDGLVTTLSICSGLFVHATVSAIGISLIVLQSAWLFSVLKMAGAGYLVYLGITSIRNAVSDRSDLNLGVRREGEFIIGRSIREGLLSNLLNPKPIIFYMAFLPQFIDPAHSALMQSLTLAFMHFLISLVWLGLVAIMVDQLRVMINRSTIRRAMDSTIGAILTALGLGLALEAVEIVGTERR
jgi:threonine/homoserine/homoserine lactone efflux protein